MSLLKIGNHIIDMSKVDLIDLQATTVASEANDTRNVVRIQLTNRRDEVVSVAGRPRHIKHGVFELDADMSEIFRWFVDEVGGQLGILDVEKAYENRAEIARRKAEMIAQMEQQRALQSVETKLKPFLVPSPDNG